MKLTHWIGVAVVAAALTALGLRLQGQDAMTPLAQRYMMLVLALGQHDPDYVDAYYGPDALRQEAAASRRSLADIDAEAHSVREALKNTRLRDDADEMTRLRR